MNIGPKAEKSKAELRNSRELCLRTQILLDPEKPVVFGRPLSAGDLAAMYEKRKACYERFADHIVDNNGTVDATVQAILDCLK